MKGIIVVDIPECCDMCKMGFNNECSDEFECFMEPNKELKNPESEKPDWCPIREIPTTLEEIKSPHSMSDYQRKGFSSGWNSCIDAIIGEK